jgi:hypothetical protein
MCKWHGSPKGRNDLSLCLEKRPDTPLKISVFSCVVVSTKLMRDSPENSSAIFIRGGEPWLMSYCWSTYFKVLRVLFLGEVSSAFLPSKTASWTPKFRHVGVDQQCPPVIRTRDERGHSAGATCTETQSRNERRVGGGSRSFWTAWWPVICVMHVPTFLLRAGPVLRTPIAEDPGFCSPLSAW